MCILSSNSIEDDERKFTEILKKVDLKKKDTLCLLFIAKNNGVKSKKLEKETNLRQPEVSISVQNLREKGWVKKGKVETEGKGRPTHVYKLNKPFQKIVSEILKKFDSKIEELEQDKTKIKELTLSILD
ncbi:MAG: MarR family transcriptional regulator [archaeon]